MRGDEMQAHKAVGHEVPTIEVRVQKFWEISLAWHKPDTHGEGWNFGKLIDALKDDDLCFAAKSPTLVKRAEALLMMVVKNKRCRKRASKKSNIFILKIPQHHHNHSHDQERRQHAAHA